MNVETNSFYLNLKQHWAYYVEKYIISAVFLFFVYTSIQTIIDNELFTRWIKVFSARNQYGSSPMISISYLLSRELLMIVFNICVASFLVIGKKPNRPPKGFHEIVVPLVATFFYLCYNLMPFLPSWLSQRNVPSSLQYPILVTAIVISLLGLLLNIISLYYLRKNFAVFVQVKEVVYKGPYSVVRHPMYLSHIMTMVAIVLSELSLGYIILILIHLAIMIYRAKLEEKAISHFDPNYLTHMNNTGFLLPKIFGRVSA